MSSELHSAVAGTLTIAMQLLVTIVRNETIYDQENYPIYQYWCNRQAIIYPTTPVTGKTVQLPLRDNASFRNED